MPLAVLAQTTVFTDNFTTDSSLGAGWFNMNNTSAASAVLNPSAGQGLALNVTAGTGKVNEEFNAFTGTPITLANVGDYIKLSVTFNTANLVGNNGMLLAGLFNSQGTYATANEGNSVTGATGDDTGYFGFLGFSTYSNGSVKTFQRNGVVGGVNELGYYSSMGGMYTQQLNTWPATGTYNMVNGTTYILNQTILKTAGGNQITYVITDNSGNPLAGDNWVNTDTASAYNTFDELNFGWYGKNGTALNGNILDVTVSDSINAPEPSTFALAGLGMLGLLIARRVRR